MITSRLGRSLFEVVVVVAVLVALMAVTLTAIQKVRASARRTEATNDVRQLMVALHQCGVATGGLLPGWCQDEPRANSLCTESAPLGEARKLIKPAVRFIAPREFGGSGAFYITSSSYDPSFAFHPTNFESNGSASYAVNYQAFVGSARRFPDGHTDGTSNTIGIAEHYARCGQLPDGIPAGNFRTDLVRGTLRKSLTGPVSGNPQSHPASFADPFYDDVHPVRFNGEGGRPAAAPSRYRLTFQVQPTVPDCDPSIPQTPHAGGMITGMMDGSVRVLRGGIDPSVFWSAVTPAGGESVTLD